MLQSCCKSHRPKATAAARAPASAMPDETKDPDAPPVETVMGALMLGLAGVVVLSPPLVAVPVVLVKPPIAVEVGGMLMVLVLPAPAVWPGARFAGAWAASSWNLAKVLPSLGLRATR